MLALKETEIKDQNGNVTHYGQVYAWGLNEDGQLGNNTNADNVILGTPAVTLQRLNSQTNEPISVGTDVKESEYIGNYTNSVVKVAAKNTHAMALTQDGTLCLGFHR
jgi:alpha-tubulin suppressor-like RCC1 family protein